MTPITSLSFTLYLYFNVFFKEKIEVVHTDEKLPFPVIPPIANRYRETNVTFGLNKWLDTNGSIPIDDGTDDVLCVETALYFIVLFKARTRYIDNCSSKHISTFRGKNER